MAGLPLTSRPCRIWLPIVLCTVSLSAQTCLILSPAGMGEDRTARLDLSLYTLSGPSPVTAQWTLQYAPSNIRSISVEDGPALDAAGKTAICAGEAAGYKCMAVGLNSKTIASGVVAKVSAVLASGAPAATVHIVNPLAADAKGSQIPILAKTLPAAGANGAAECRALAQPKARTGGK